MINQQITNRAVRVGLISLGCAKNLVDAEIMLGALAHDGLEITNDAALADVVIVNTCSFIESAQQESIDAILESDQVREAQNRGQGLVVAGCLPQRFQAELPTLLPEVDAIMGIDQVKQVSRIVHEALAHRAERLRQLATAPRSGRKKQTIVPKELNPAEPDSAWSASKTRTIRAGTAFPAGPQPPKEAPLLVAVTNRPSFIPDYATPRFRLTPRHFAYLKIAEGCNHPCSFCIIPRMRGSHRSRPPADVVAEARQLVAAGVKELNLISQDTTYYGLDLRPDRRGAIASPSQFNAAARALPAHAPTLCALLRELEALPGQFWIRLLYTHPAHWTDALIQTIAECRKVARYVDIPLQHIAPAMLERMRRETTRQYIVDLLARIRAGIPGIALRTTFIVGFPGETDLHFQSLLEFIEQTRFERLGVFTYSAETGTPAAKMAGQLDEKVKKKRREQAMALQHKIARQTAQSFVGRTLPVLVEKSASAAELRQARISSWEHGLVRERDRHQGQLDGCYWVARGEADAPDIDGRVYVDRKGALPIGEFATVKVLGHTDYDLIAEPV